MLAAYAPFQETLPIVRGHHERYDGKGYPDGLAGEEISIGARITAVADSFDAMISNRTYRKGLGFEKTIAELQKGKGTQFDGNVVDVLLRYIDEIGQEAFENKYCSHTKEVN